MTAFDVCGGFCTFLQKKGTKVLTTIVCAILFATPIYSIGNNGANNSLCDNCNTNYIVLATIERTIAYKNRNGILFCKNSNINSISPISHSIPQLANNAQQLNLKLLVRSKISGKKELLNRDNFSFSATPRPCDLLLIDAGTSGSLQ